ncbi:TPA: zonular occludens toxin domain-containing protein, partial [Neisseria gonorrhoeae]
LYFCHIDGLDKRKFNARELAEGQIMSAPLRDVIPEGAVLIVGEAHYTYPVRAAGRPVPPYIQELTELRHHGHTVILMTRHPSQLDIFVRNLVSKHVHLERKAIGMKQYYWYKCVTSLDNPAGVSGVEAANWKPPK